MGHIPTPAQSLAGELFQMYRRGWTDGAAGRQKSPLNMSHPTRPELPAMYLRGFTDGEALRNESLRALASEVGFAASITR